MEGQTTTKTCLGGFLTILINLLIMVIFGFKVYLANENISTIVSTAQLPTKVNGGAQELNFTIVISTED